MRIIENLITLENEFKFKCIQCGKCCKNYKVIDPRNRQDYYSYNPRGKLSKTLSGIPTVYYDEVKEIESYIENNDSTTKDKLFVSSASYFLKEYNYEFVIKYWVKTVKGMCIFYNKEKRSCTIYPVRPLLCKIYPIQFYLNNDRSNNLININPNCSAIEKGCKESNSNFQPNEYAVLGQKKSFVENSKYLEYDSYRTEKLNVFMYVWNDLFIDPAIITPEIVKGYQRQDMSYFWKWLLDNINDFSSLKRIRTKIKQYKELLSKFHELYNFNIKYFLE